MMTLALPVPTPPAGYRLITDEERCGARGLIKGLRFLDSYGQESVRRLTLRWHEQSQRWQSVVWNNWAEFTIYEAALWDDQYYCVPMTPP